MNAQIPLLASTTVHDRRNLPLWVVLAFSAGAVNAAALAACQRFVSHVTGTVTRVGADYGSAYLLLDYAAVLGAFVVGAMSSFWMLDGRRLRGKAPFVGLPLAMVAMILALEAALGRFGSSGPVGKTVEREEGDEDIVAHIIKELGQVAVLVGAGRQPVQQDDGAFGLLPVRQGEGQAERLQVPARCLGGHECIDARHGVVVAGGRVRCGVERHRLQRRHRQRPDVDDEIDAQKKRSDDRQHAANPGQPLGHKDSAHFLDKEV